MKYFRLALFLTFAVAGCKPKEKEQVIANKVVESEQALITGQIFIVTKGRANVVLGDEKIALLDAHETRTYFNSKALEWSNTLAIAQAKVDEATAKVDLATTNLNALYKNDLEKYASAKKYHENKMVTVPTGTPEWDDAFEWSRKLERQIRDLVELKKSSGAQKQVLDARKRWDAVVKEQAGLWDEINWPSAGDFWPRIEITTTDSDGRFKFVVPKSSANSNMILFAKAERQVADEKENYWWMVNVNLNGRKTEEFVLSNDNKDTAGVWGWFDERSVKEYMVEYITKMEAAKAHRDFQDWLEKLEDGK